MAKINVRVRRLQVIFFWGKIDVFFKKVIHVEDIHDQ